MGKSSVKAPELNYESLWNNYQTWAMEDKRWYEGRRGSAIADMARRGIVRGTERWDRRLSSIEESYAEKRQELTQGATFKGLQSGMNPLKRIGFTQDILPSPDYSQQEVEEFYSAKYGNIEGFGGQGNQINQQRARQKKSTDLRMGSVNEADISNPWMRRSRWQ